MVDFDEIVNTAATSLGCDYVFGDKDDVELYLPLFEMTKKKYLVMLAPYIETHTINGGLLEYTTYPLTIGIGVQGLLSDDFQHKNRTELNDIKKLMLELFKLLGYCSTPYIWKSSEILTEINRFSENLDVVVGKITLTDE